MSGYKSDRPPPSRHERQEATAFVDSVREKLATTKGEAMPDDETDAAEREREITRLRQALDAIRTADPDMGYAARVAAAALSPTERQDGPLDVGDVARVLVKYGYRTGQRDHDAGHVTAALNALLS